MISLVSMLLYTITTTPHPMKNFASIPDENEHQLILPFDVSWSDKHGLFVVDPKAAQIFHWRTNGTYAGSFGSRGKGPKEFSFPSHISVFKDTVVVWDAGSSKMMFYSTDGEFLNSQPFTRLMIRRFEMVNEQHLLIAHHHISSKRESNVFFDIYNREGKPIHRFLHYINPLFKEIASQASHDFTLKAFPDEAVIQRVDEEKLIFSFSLSDDLFTVNNKLEVKKWLTLPFIRSEPTAEEIDFVNQIPVPESPGKTLANFSPMKLDFSLPKASYTHFLKTDDQLIFVLTPMGLNNGFGHGFHQGRYVLANDDRTGFSKQGTYLFEPGELIFFDRGKTFAFLLDSQDNYKLKELNLFKSTE